jgi:Spy/CpxP family protein refolding chaperone
MSQHLQFKAEKPRSAIPVACGLQALSGACRNTEKACLEPPFEEGLMKENLKTILFIASVALNAVFAVTYVTYKLPSLSGVQPGALKGPLFLQLDLTPDQSSQFNAERERFHSQLQTLGKAIKTKQLELIDLLAAKPPEQLAIEKKQEEIQRIQGTVQDRVIAHFLQASSFLSPEQQTRFFQLIKRRIETSIQACPPWLRSEGQEQPGVYKNQ